MPSDQQVPALNAVVVGRTEVTPGLIIVRVAPDGWQLSPFEPGQYTVLGLSGDAPRCDGSDPEEASARSNGKLIKRAYSIASSSKQQQYLEFYINLVRSGTLTPRIFALGVGDRVWLGRKTTGTFTLDTVDGDQNLILFATGTGLAPYISMIRSVLTGDGDRRFAVVHGARHSWDLGYQSELMALAELCDWFDYIPVVSRPRQEPVPWGGKTGYCQEVWKTRLIDQFWQFRPTPENTHIFLCGSPGMIEAMLWLLAEERFREHTKKSPGQVHLEKYW